VRIALALLFAGLLDGCAYSTAPAVSEPRPYVLQYAATYYGGPDNTSFDWVELRRDGTFRAMVDGAAQEGRFDEEVGAGKEPQLRFAGDTEFAGALHADWAAGHKLSVSRNGVTEDLRTASVGGEEMCEATGGAWQDDDADNAGLYCTCGVGMKYIPSTGGCTD
jgi:hypothetical protein